MRTILTCLTIFTFLNITSCKKNKCDEITVGLSPVNSVNSTDTISLGQSTIITVIYPSSSGCQYLESFEEIQDGYKWKINVNVANDPCGFCNQAALPKSADYQFQADIVGTYLLDFGENSILDTIVVQ